MMTAHLLRGADVAAEEKARVGALIRKAVEGGAPPPVLVGIHVGRHPACESYAEVQARVARAVGVEYRPLRLAADSAQADILRAIDECNRDRSSHGLLVHLPLPAHVNPRIVQCTVDPHKDVEGLHPMNLGRFVGENSVIVSPTVSAVLALLDACGCDVEGKDAVVVGHSDLIGKPLALQLLHRKATVTVCHLATAERGRLADHVSRAEVLISAVGKPGVIQGAWIREGAVVIDVGTSQVGDRIVGDVEYEAAARRASYITPVPGGVGPVTVAKLMRNVTQVYCQQEGLPYDIS